MKMEYGVAALSEQITQGEAGCEDFFSGLLAEPPGATRAEAGSGNVVKASANMIAIGRTRRDVTRRK